MFITALFVSHTLPYRNNTHTHTQTHTHTHTAAHMLTYANKCGHVKTNTSLHVCFTCINITQYVNECTDANA